MITRIKIDGFKSFINTQLYLGPFTCIAGANAIGKSNFFDALVFLSNLADNTVIQAAKSVRSESERHLDIRDIFFKSGSDYLKHILFEVDILVPEETTDDLGQVAKATITSLRYTLELKLNEDISGKEPIEIVREELIPVSQRDAKRSFYFLDPTDNTERKHARQWVESVLIGKRSTKNPFISTDGAKIKLHQDGGKGRSAEFVAEKMPRTLLSTVTAESPTAFLVRQEMRNWMVLQFEPSALRKPNSTYEVRGAEITASGSNLPATLYRLNSEKREADVYQKLANKLHGLVENVDSLSVDRDEKRDLLTLQLTFKNGLTLPAQSLSDGTLRFLGIAIIEEDTKSNGLICLEEPENGINPKKVKKMVELLQNLATTTNEPIASENVLRQVIINTHSPKVVSAVDADSLFLAKELEVYLPEFKRKVKCTGFSALNNTWKTINGLCDVTTLGEIIGYLDSNTLISDSYALSISTDSSDKKKMKKTVAQHVQPELGFENL